MRRSLARLIFLFCASAAAFADEPLAVPIETAAIYDDFKAHYRIPNDDCRLLEKLAAAPDADICLLQCALHDSDYQGCGAADALIKLNKQRTFDRLLQVTHDPNSQIRARAIDLLGRLKRPAAVGTLLPIVHDRAQWVRLSAIRALGGLKDPRVEPVLLELLNDSDAAVVVGSREALSVARSPAAFPIIARWLKESNKDEHGAAITSASNYHNVAAVNLLLEDYRASEHATDDGSQRLSEWRIARLADLLEIAEPLIGPLPDPIADEWADYWARAQPLLTEDLQLKRVAPPATRYAETTFTSDFSEVKMSVRASRSTYRPGEPIQLRFTLENLGPRPVRTFIPRPPSGWRGTMAYGIHLTRDGRDVMQFLPSSAYQGSYGGQAPPETLGPGQSTDATVCLQYWLANTLKTSLVEGDYRLAITFDPTCYPENSDGRLSLGRYRADPIHFTVKGTIQSPQELLATLTALSDNRFFLNDLHSGNSKRSEPAWRTLIEYGDARLGSIVNAIAKEYPEVAAGRGAALRPFENAPR